MHVGCFSFPGYVVVSLSLLVRSLPWKQKTLTDRNSMCVCRCYIEYTCCFSLAAAFMINYTIMCVYPVHESGMSKI